MPPTKTEESNDRRSKFRFAIHRELRYRVIKDTNVVESGAGHTMDIGSGGVAFSTGHSLPAECYIELSISWPVLLDDTCPMRLVVFGQVLRSEDGRCACTIDKYEFRTQSRVLQTLAPVRNDSMLQRWAETVRKDAMMKSRTAMAV